MNLCLFEDIVPQAAEPPRPPRRQIDHAALWRQEMAEVIQERLSVYEPWASEMAREIVEGLRGRIGGAMIYVPAPDKQARNVRIRTLFTGRNVEELCDSFGLGRSTVYRICKLR